VRIVWSEPAEFDLDDLYDFIAKDSPFYAERVIDRILNAVANLTACPRIGRQVPEADAEQIRELIVQGHRVIYSIDDDDETIHILALIHVRQDLKEQSKAPWD
jgi:plasmid stabilization system protein ParE